MIFSLFPRKVKLTQTMYVLYHVSFKIIQTPGVKTDFCNEAAWPRAPEVAGPSPGVVRGGPESRSSATHVNRQLVCLLPLGICYVIYYVHVQYFVSEFVYIGPKKNHWGVVNYVYIAFFFPTERRTLIIDVDKF